MILGRNLVSWILTGKDLGVNRIVAVKAIKNEFEGPDVESDWQNPEWNDNGSEEVAFSDDSDEMDEDSEGDY